MKCDGMTLRVRYSYFSEISINGGYLKSTPPCLQSNGVTREPAEERSDNVRAERAWPYGFHRGYPHAEPSMPVNPNHTRTGVLS